MRSLGVTQWTDPGEPLNPAKSKVFPQNTSVNGSEHGNVGADWHLRRITLLHCGWGKAAGGLN